MSICHKPRLLVYSTVSTGLDAIAEVHRKGYCIAGIVGLHLKRVILRQSVLQILQDLPNR